MSTALIAQASYGSGGLCRQCSRGFYKYRFKMRKRLNCLTAAIVQEHGQNELTLTSTLVTSKIRSLESWFLLVLNIERTRLVSELQLNQRKEWTLEFDAGVTWAFIIGANFPESLTVSAPNKSDRFSGNHAYSVRVVADYPCYLPCPNWSRPTLWKDSCSLLLALRQSERHRWAWMH